MGLRLHRNEDPLWTTAFTELSETRDNCICARDGHQGAGVALQQSYQVMFYYRDAVQSVCWICVILVLLQRCVYGFRGAHSRLFYKWSKLFSPHCNGESAHLWASIIPEDFALNWPAEGCYVTGCLMEESWSPSAFKRSRVWCESSTKSVWSQSSLTATQMYTNTCTSCMDTAHDLFKKSDCITESLTMHLWK